MSLKDLGVGLKCLLVVCAVLLPPDLCRAGEPEQQSEEEQQQQGNFSETVEVVGEKIEQAGGKITRDRIVRLQPVDVGDLLKKDVAGLGTIRKSGIGLDPILRGLAKENLPVVVDGAQLHGACPNRMDPPTFHVTPNQVESVTVVKGPFDVTLGPGEVGGTVAVRTRQPEMYQNFAIRPELRAGTESTSLSKRAAIDLTGGQQPFAFRFSYDYQNFDGYENRNRVTAGFQQQNAGLHADFLTAAWGRLELGYTGQRSKDVFYPTLAMDSPEDNLDLVSAGIQFLQLPSAFKTLEFRVYNSKVYHRMDNLSKFEYARPAPMMKMEAIANNRTTGGMIKADVAALDGIPVGADYSTVWWDARQTVLWPVPGPGLRAIPDATIDDLGLFVQPRKVFGPLTLDAGLRTDFVRSRADAIGPVEAGYYRLYYGIDLRNSDVRSNTNVSGFARATYRGFSSASLYFGVGRGVRSPDARERYRILGAIPGGRYEIGNPDLQPEANLHFEAGASAPTGSRLQYGISLYHSSIHNFITRVATGKTYMMKPVLANENVDATLYGFELSAGWALTGNFSVNAETSYIHGDNDTYGRPLGEILPWEGRISLRYDRQAGKYWAEVAARMAAVQDRFDPVVDAGRTPGFTTYDVLFGWKPHSIMMVTAGVQNLLDRFYFEHTAQRFAFNQDGFTTADRIPEPGRSFYLNLTAAF